MFSHEESVYEMPKPYHSPFKSFKFHRKVKKRKKEKKKSKFQNSIIFSKFEVKFSNVNQAIYSSNSTSIQSIKAPAKILFETFCTQDFQIVFSNVHDTEKGHNLDMEINMRQLFFHEE